MRTSDNIEKLIKNAAIHSNPDINQVVLRELLQEFDNAKEQKPAVAQPSERRTIMKSQITKLAAAAVIMAAILIGIHMFGGSIEGASVAWADVLENIQKLKTLTLLVRAKEEGPPVLKLIVIDPYLIRIELLGGETFGVLRPDVQIPDGSIWIIDTKAGKALMLNPEKKTATELSADKQILDVYNTFRNFKDWPGFSVQEIGERQIDGKQAIGFHLKKKNESDEMMVWVDPETQLPIRIEYTLKHAEEQIQRAFTTDIVFEAELDKSLFSLEAPEGYELKKFDYDPINRLKSAVNMDRIVKACRKYVNEHEGQWPDSLEELPIYGLDKDVFTNPRQPARKAGYVYLKPAASPPESSIVLYEAYDVWDSGINVGLANYHIEFIKEEADFKNRLKNTLQRK